MVKEAKLSWMDVLAIVQKIAPTEGWAFTTSELVGAGLDPVEAAKWMTKFVDWGYVSRGEFATDKAGVGGRPKRLYHVLKRGLEKDVTIIGLSDVDKLLEAVKELREQPDQNGYERALSNLFKVADQVSEDREKRLNKKKE